MNYREPLFRPPAEADSLIFQAAYGCAHNSCRFCLMYKWVKYEIRPIEEILSEIEGASRVYSGERRFFLADGDAMALPFDTLRQIFKKINQFFPNAARINTYANGSSILALTKEELAELHSLKLNTVYLGLETGSQELLDKVCKKEKVEDMVKAVQIVQSIGIKASVMVLLGLAGKDGSEGHAIKTAEALNQMQPRLLSALRFVEFPRKTKMFDGYKSSTEYEVVSELYTLIQRLDLNKTVFRANHSSNPVPLAGRFPQDKQALLDEIKRLLQLGRLDRSGPGHLPLWL
jgi:radical SAM superfamily enzyme YgiQ (UPF0313 family)